MSIKQGRSQLKTYFETGDRPTEEEFATSIDSGLNQLDDDIHADGNGNIGIGTDTPEKKLDVRGDTIISGNLGVNTTDPKNHFQIGKRLGFTDGKDVNNASQITHNFYLDPYDNKIKHLEDGEASMITFRNGNIGVTMVDSGLKGSPLNFSNFRTPLMLKNNGNVGINTQTPSNKLHVESNNTRQPDNTLKTGLRLNNAGETNINGQVLVSDNDGNAIWVPPSAVNSEIWIKDDATQHIKNANTGNVGIGIDPKEKLHVKGRVKLENNEGLLTLTHDTNTHLLKHDRPSGAGNIQYLQVWGTGASEKIGGYIQTRTLSDENGLYATMGSLETSLYIGAGHGKELYFMTDGNGGNPAAKMSNDKNWFFYDNNIYLRNSGDKNHGIGWFNNSKPPTDPNSKNFAYLQAYPNFSGIQADEKLRTLDGPTVFGWNGGALGSKLIENGKGNTTREVETVALQWFPNKSVDFKGSITIKGLKPMAKKSISVGKSDMVTHNNGMRVYAVDDSDIQPYSPNEYEASIAGFQIWEFDPTASISNASAMYITISPENLNTSSARWLIFLRAPTAQAEINDRDVYYKVDILFIRKELME